MEVRIQAIHFDATEKLQDFIQKKTIITETTGANSKYFPDSEKPQGEPWVILRKMWGLFRKTATEGVC